MSPSQVVESGLAGVGGGWFLGALSSASLFGPWRPCPGMPRPLLPGDAQNFLQKPLLKMALWALLSDENFNNGRYLYIAYLQGAKGTPSIPPPQPFLPFFFFLILF